MTRIRTLLAWLLMAALPLQGLAAASMLFCGMAAQHAPVQQVPVQQAKGEHDHSQHSHAAVEKAQSADSTSTSTGTVAKLPDASHKCGVCAACCNSLAIAEFSQPMAFAPAPQADLIEPFVLIQARPSPVPDKPPRA